MDRDTYLERIKKLKSTRKITNEKLSEMTGIPLGTLSKLLAGINDSPKLSNIVAISRALDCSLDWLITGVPENTHNYTLEPTEMDLVEAYRGLDEYGRALALSVLRHEKERVARQADDTAILLHDNARHAARRGSPRLRRPTEERETTRLRPAAAAPTPAASKTAKDTGAVILDVPPSLMDRHAGLPAGLRRRSISLYDMPVSAGVGEFLADSDRTEIMIPDDSRTAGANYALRINGDSMEPRYRSGDIILVETAESVEEGELGVFVLDGSGYFKKYGGDHLISLNPQYPPICLRDFSSASCLGRVVGKLKRK